MFIGGLIGLLGSVLPEGIGIVKSVVNHKQEIDLLKATASIEANKSASQERIAGIQSETHLRQMESDQAIAQLAAEQKSTSSAQRHDKSVLAGASQWVVNIAAVIRPMLAIVAATLFVYIVGVTVWTSATPTIAVQSLIALGVMDIIAAVFTFYFGRRSIEKLKGA